MTSSSLSTMITASLWTNVTFAFLSAFLMFALAYQYLLPTNATPNKHVPKAFNSLIFSTATTLFVACILNTVYFVQEVKSIPNSSGSMHISNLSVSGWIAIMFFATTSRAVPFVLLLLTFVDILASRWDTLVQQILSRKYKFRPGESTESKRPFLGWHWKMRATHFLALMLVILPIASSLTSAIGVATNHNVTIQDGSVNIRHIEGLGGVLRLANAFDGMRCALIAIGVIDIGVCTFLLFKKLRAARYVDPIIDLLLLVFTPLLFVLAIPTVVTSFFHTLGSASDLTLARVDFASQLVTTIIIFITIIALSILYQSHSWWKLAVIVTPDAEFGGHELSKSRGATSSEGSHSHT